MRFPSNLGPLTAQALHKKVTSGFLCYFRPKIFILRAYTFPHIFWFLFFMKLILLLTRPLLFPDDTQFIQRP